MYNKNMYLNKYLTTLLCLYFIDGLKYNIIDVLGNQMKYCYLVLPKIDYHTMHL